MFTTNNITGDDHLLFTIAYRRYNDRPKSTPNYLYMERPTELCEMDLKGELQHLSYVTYSKI